MASSEKSTSAPNVEGDDSRDFVTFMPPEITAYIFLKLPNKDLFGSCPRVSQRWYNFMNSDLFLRSFLVLEFGQQAAPMLNRQSPKSLMGKLRQLLAFRCQVNTYRDKDSNGVVRQDGKVVINLEELIPGFLSEDIPLYIGIYNTLLSFPYVIELLDSELTIRHSVTSVGWRYEEQAGVTFPVFSWLHLLQSTGREFEIRLLLSSDAAHFTRKVADHLHFLKRIQYGSLAEIVAHFKSGDAEINGIDRRRPLIEAASRGNIEIVRKLLDYGADIGIADLDARFPLGEAAKSGRCEVARLLISRGASVTQRDREGKTPLLLSARYGKCDMLRLLLDSGASLEEQDNEGCNPLMLAVRHHSTETISFLLDLDASLLEKPNQKGETPLFLTVWHTGLDCAVLLLDRGASIEQRDREGMTPFLLAARIGNCDMVRLLLDSGASIEKQDDEGYIALGNAAKRGCCDAVPLLISRGASVGQRDRGGRTPLLLAAQYGKCDMVRLLLDSGATLEERDNDGSSPLLLAVSKFNTIESIRFLLELDPSLLEQPNRKGNTPLLQAVWYELFDCVTLLLDHGANVNAQSVAGYTPLKVAEVMGNSEIVRLLTERGAVKPKPPENVDSWTIFCIVGFCIFCAVFFYWACSGGFAASRAAG